MASVRIQRRIDFLLDEADEAVSRFDWEAVRERAQAVLAFDSDNGEALAFLEAAQRSGVPLRIAEAPGILSGSIGRLEHDEC